jgi:muramoyltetrapeptide carboxypeptidase
MLKPGARIAVIAPSGQFEPYRVEKGMNVLREWGYKPKYLPGALARWRYFASDEDSRAQDLQDALSGEWDAAWMARGGYGAGPLLPRLDLSRVSRAVPFLGFSDGTALLNPLADHGNPAIHAPVLHSLTEPADAPSRERLRKLLAGEPLDPVKGESLVPGDTEGPLRGGNLSVLASLCGTAWQFKAAGKIVFLEDTNEPAYRVDRLLCQLLMSGALQGARGFVLGEFVNCDVPEKAKYTLQDVILDLLKPLDVPILGKVPIGHGPSNHCFAFANGAIQGDTLVVAEPAHPAA